MLPLLSLSDMSVSPLGDYQPRPRLGVPCLKPWDGSAPMQASSVHRQPFCPDIACIIPKDSARLSGTLSIRTGRVIARQDALNVHNNSDHIADSLLGSHL